MGVMCWYLSSVFYVMGGKVLVPIQCALCYGCKVLVPVQCDLWRFRLSEGPDRTGLWSGVLEYLKNSQGL